MKYGRYGYSYLLLRVSLGLVFLWIGIDIFRNQTDWIGFLPLTNPLGLARADALRGISIFDIVVGLLLITGHFPRLTSLLAAVHIASVLVVNRLDAVLIRDVGLLGATLALLVWPHRYHRRHWWQRRFRSQNDDEI